MNMNRKFLAALIAGAAALGTTSPALAVTHGDDYYMAPGTYLKIVDHETFGADQIQKFDLSNLALGRIGDVGTKSFKFSRCAGGEVRVEVTVTVTRLSPSSSTVRYNSSLYEGTSCSSTDLEDTDPIGTSPLDIYQGLYLYNYDEGGDYATGSLSVKKVPVY